MVFYGEFFLGLRGKLLYVGDIVLSGSGLLVYYIFWNVMLILLLCGLRVSVFWLLSFIWKFFLKLVSGFLELKMRLMCIWCCEFCENCGVLVSRLCGLVDVCSGVCIIRWECGLVVSEVLISRFVLVWGWLLLFLVVRVVGL